MTEIGSHYNLRSFVERYICNEDEFAELASVLGKSHLGFAGWVNHMEDCPPTPKETRRTEIEKSVALRLSKEFLNGHWKIEGTKDRKKSDFSQFDLIDYRHFDGNFEIDIVGNMISFFNGPTFQKISISLVTARPLVQQILEIIERVAKDKDPTFFKRQDFEKAIKGELDVYNLPEKFDAAFKAADIPPEFHKGGRRNSKK